MAGRERICALCNKTDTSQWRSGSNGEQLCNACGIRLNRKPAMPGSRGAHGTGSNSTSRSGKSTDASASKASSQKNSTTPTGIARSPSELAGSQSENSKKGSSGAKGGHPISSYYPKPRKSQTDRVKKQIAPSPGVNKGHGTGRNSHSPHGKGTQDRYPSHGGREVLQISDLLNETDGAGSSIRSLLN